MRFLDEAQKIIALQSVSKGGNEEVVNYFANLMEESRIKISMQQATHSLDDVSKRQFNIIGTLGDPLVDRKIKKGLLLLSHLDTSDPGIREYWTENQGNPFQILEKNDTLYGLGTSDGKLDFLAKIFAVQRMRDKKLKQPVYLVGTCGEKLGMLGVRYLLKSYALNPQFVMVAAPSSLRLVTAQKQQITFRVSLGFQATERDAKGFNRRITLYSAGRSGLSCYPETGINAFLQAFDFICLTVDRGFDLQLTRMEGGELVSQIPDRARFEFYLTSHQFEDFKRFFREFLKSESKETAFKAELGGAGEAGLSFYPPFILPCLSDVIETFRAFFAGISSQSDSSFDVPQATYSLSRVEQGSKKIDLIFDVRLLPNQKADEIEKSLIQALQAVALRYPALNIRAQHDQVCPGYEAAPGDEWLSKCAAALEEVNIKPEFEKNSLGGEAGYFAQAGYRSLAFGPGEAKGNIHSPNEHTDLPRLQQAVSFYEKIIEKVCL